MANEMFVAEAALYDAFKKHLDMEQRMDKDLAVHMFPIMLRFVMSEEGRCLLSEYKDADIDWTQLELMCGGYICVE